MNNLKHEIKIEPITEADMMEVYKLSNEDSVRLYSFNQNKIELNGHKQWFANKMADTNVIMLKALLDGVFAGQTRLDFEGGNALIGVSVKEKFRGMGIASKLIDAAVNEAKKNGIKNIDAEIKPENKSSIKLFEKNGFSYISEIEVGGKTAYKYIYKIS